MEGEFEQIDHNRRALGMPRVINTKAGAERERGRQTL